MNDLNQNHDVIGIIAPANLKYLPYIQYYIDVLKASNMPYKIISWDKYDLSEAGVDYALKFKTDDFDRKRMFYGYTLFAKACRKFIRENHIKKLIILTAAPAFFIGERFLKRFQNQYILDIRDDSPFIRRFLKNLIDFVPWPDK